jgi:hypothetical protein
MRFHNLTRRVWLPGTREDLCARSVGCITLPICKLSMSRKPAQGAASHPANGREVAAAWLT